MIDSKPQVASYDAIHPGTLHLHGHDGIVVESCPVDLRKGRGAHGVGIESGEQLPNRCTELRLDDAHDRCVVKGLHPLMEPVQRGRVTFWHKIRAYRQRLSRLHEGRAKPLGQVRQPSGEWILHTLVVRADAPEEAPDAA